MVELTPQAAQAIDVYAYVGIVDEIKDVFSAPVDVSNRALPRPSVRPGAERDAIYAF